MNGDLYYELLIRGFFALILAVVLAWRLYDEWEMNGRISRFLQPVISPFLLPMFLILMTVIEPILTNTETIGTTMSGITIPIAFTLCIYYTILIPLHPMLRRFFSARTCAGIWMLPNALYIIFTGGFRLTAPIWNITLKGRWPITVFYIWASGFLAVMLWYTVRHIQYRREVMRKAEPVTEQDILDMWNRIHFKTGFKKRKYRLYRSGTVTVPVSVGLFFPRVVLPMKCYKADDLELILRHELIHIRREDNHAKFFMAFCTALCWFNPLMWTSVKRLGEDVELSCDEAVLKSVYADDAKKRRYADLILTNAGDERGFTTCLSAKADSLKYRLSRIVNPGRLWTGGMLTGLIFFILLMFSGTVALSYGGENARDTVLAGESPEIYSIRYYEDISGLYPESWDREALLDYIGGLRIYDRTGLYSEPWNEDHEIIIICHPEGAENTSDTSGSRIGFIKLTDTYLRLGDLIEDKSETYYLYEDVEWEYIKSLLDAGEPMPEPPELWLNAGGMPEESLGKIVAVRQETTDPEGSRTQVSENKYSCEFHGSASEDLELIFSYAPSELHAYVTPMHSEGGTESAIAVTEGHIDCIPESAVYRIVGRFGSTRNTSYEMEYLVLIVRPEDTEEPLY